MILVRAYQHFRTNGIIHDPARNCDKKGGRGGREVHDHWREFETEREAIATLGQPLHTCQHCFRGQGIPYPRGFPLPG